MSQSLVMSHTLTVLTCGFVGISLPPHIVQGLAQTFQPYILLSSFHFLWVSLSSWLPDLEEQNCHWHYHCAVQAANVPHQSFRRPLLAHGLPAVSCAGRAQQRAGSAHRSQAHCDMQEDSFVVPYSREIIWFLATHEINSPDYRWESGLFFKHCILYMYCMFMQNQKSKDNRKNPVQKIRM